MTTTEITTELTALFEQQFGQQPISIQAFPHTASGRRYFRMKNGEISVIGSYGKDKKENRAFLYFSQYFKEKGANVPLIYVSKDDLFYLQEDLGDETLMQRNKTTPRQKNNFPLSLLEDYQKTIERLITLQVHAAKDLDYTYAYPRSAFDEQSIHWDLNYFKYYFLNLSGVPYDEGALESDFLTLINYLRSTDTHYFLFRDFQSRNVMFLNNEPYFIDYQGGRQGALQYDLASLLFQSKAEIPQKTREKLLDFYIETAQKHIPIEADSFRQYYYAYVLVRLLQVLGAYGKRGLIEKMPYFIQSIPLALQNIKWWLNTVNLPIQIPYLKHILEQLTETTSFQSLLGKNAPLTVKIFSFSYKEGLPQDTSGNGGGFVFDCRHIFNPGRFKTYKKLTGRDAPVQKFLLEESKMPDFLEDAFSIVDRAVEKYIERNFESLMVSFGCTGGQHRSVYSADRLAIHLEEKFQVKTVVKHIVQERKNWVNEGY